MNKLLKPLLAGVAIILTIPAIFLPLQLQNRYKRTMSILTYKLKDCKFITNWMLEKENVFIYRRERGDR
jgi:hypothetical protein